MDNDAKNKESLIKELLTKGEAFFASGKYQEAIETFDAILKIDPKNIRALNNKGFTLSKLGNDHWAIEMYEKVLEIYPNNINALNNKVHSFTKLSRYDEAIGICNTVLRIDPKNTRTLRMKSFSSAKLNQSSDDIEITDKILKLDKEDIYALRNKAFYLNKSGKYKDAIEVCNEILKLLPQDIRTLHIKAFALFRTNMYQDAIKIYETILVIDPQNIDAIKSRKFATLKLNGKKETAEHEKIKDLNAMYDEWDQKRIDGTHLTESYKTFIAGLVDLINTTLSQIDGELQSVSKYLLDAHAYHELERTIINLKSELQIEVAEFNATFSMTDENETDESPYYEAYTNKDEEMEAEKEGEIRRQSSLIAIREGSINSLEQEIEVSENLLELSGFANEELREITVTLHKLGLVVEYAVKAFPDEKIEGLKNRINKYIHVHCLNILRAEI